jgi:predicted CoA-binding protein
VAGVSRDKSHHPVGNLIYDRLKKTGHDVFAVNPHMETFEGDHCYPDLQSIPGGVDGVVVITGQRPPSGSCMTAVRPEFGVCGCINRC